MYYRIKTYRTGLKEWNFAKQKRLIDDSFLVDNIRELWLQNFSTTTMLYALKHHGYDLLLLQLRNLRLHPSVHTLFQNRTNLRKEEVSNITDEGIAEALESGQWLKWGAGSYTSVNIRMSGVLVSD